MQSKKSGQEEDSLLPTLNSLCGKIPAYASLLPCCCHFVPVSATLFLPPVFLNILLHSPGTVNELLLAGKKRMAR